VLKGAARLRFEDETVEMQPGDFVNIPAHKKHRVEWTTPDEPTIWLAVHFGDHQSALIGSGHLHNSLKLLDQCLLPGFNLPFRRSHVEEVCPVHLRKLHLSS
jgi:hypothetical protein